MCRVARLTVTPEPLAEGGQGQVRGVGHGLPEGRLVGGPKRDPFGDRPAGGHLAGPLPAADDLPDPLGRVGVLAGEVSERQPGVIVGEHADPEVERVPARDPELVRLGRAVRDPVPGPDGAAKKGGAGVIPLTVPEVRKLLLKLVWARVAPADDVLRWSEWRRKHQHRARRYHHRKRGARPPDG